VTSRTNAWNAGRFRSLSQGPGSIWPYILRADRGADRRSFHRLRPVWNPVVGVWPPRMTISVLVALTPIEPRRLLQKTGCNASLFFGVTRMASTVRLSGEPRHGQTPGVLFVSALAGRDSSNASGLRNPGPRAAGQMIHRGRASSPLGHLPSKFDKDRNWIASQVR